MANKTPCAVVLSHVPFEDLGSLQGPLCTRGFEINMVEAPTTPFPLGIAQSCELLVLLGGPIGVYDGETYPFLNEEIACIGERLNSRRPTLGICLGAQLMAAALGARVYPGLKGKEIGWAPILPPIGAAPPAWFEPLLEPGLSLFHWHGDTFDLPDGASLLARTERYSNQAFALENFGLGLQFHAEVTAQGLERWYVGHACELGQAKINPAALRSAALEHGPKLEAAAGRFWSSWLEAALPDYIL